MPRRPAPRPETAPMAEDIDALLDERPVGMAPSRSLEDVLSARRQPAENLAALRDDITAAIQQTVSEMQAIGSQLERACREEIERGADETRGELQKLRQEFQQLLGSGENSQIRSSARMGRPSAMAGMMGNLSSAISGRWFAAGDTKLDPQRGTLERSGTMTEEELKEKTARQERVAALPPRMQARANARPDSRPAGGDGPLQLNVPSGPESCSDDEDEDEDTESSEGDGSPTAPAPPERTALVLQDDRPACPPVGRPKTPGDAPPVFEEEAFPPPRGSPGGSPSSRREAAVRGAQAARVQPAGGAAEAMELPGLVSRAWGSAATGQGEAPCGEGPRAGRAGLRAAAGSERSEELGPRVTFCGGDDGGDCSSSSTSTVSAAWSEANGGGRGSGRRAPDPRLRPQDSRLSLALELGKSRKKTRR
ncbi:unnamed protein product, partial [Prorocentrum cordatum]